MLLILAIAAVSAMGVYLDILPAPIDRDFTDLDAESEVIVPCPPQDALPVEFTSVSANVFNATDRSGLAGEVGTSLQSAGILVGVIANYGESYEGTALIRTGKTGVTSAYTAAYLLPGATIELDNTRADATIDIILGSEFGDVADPATAAPDLAVPLVGIEGCTPWESLPETTAAESA